jgi:hypothetical protein
MPEILFKLDNSIEQGAHILGLIRQMENQEMQAQAGNEVAHESD